MDDSDDNGIGDSGDHSPDFTGDSMRHRQADGIFFGVAAVVAILFTIFIFVYK